MPISIQIWDGSHPGKRTAAGVLSFERMRITARELLREPVRQEVERYNRNLPEVFLGLVQPEESESLLNGYRMKMRRPLDWEAQYSKACSSFERNGFLIFAGDRQVADLDEELELTPQSEVQFV